MQWKQIYKRYFISNTFRGKHRNPFKRCFSKIYSCRMSTWPHFVFTLHLPMHQNSSVARVRMSVKSWPDSDVPRERLRLAILVVCSEEPELNARPSRRVNLQLERRGIVRLCVLRRISIFLLRNYCAWRNTNTENGEL